MIGKEVVRWSLFIIVSVLGLWVWGGMTPPADAADPHGVEAASYALVVAIALFVLLVEETDPQGFWAKARKMLVQMTAALAAYQGSWEWLQSSMGQPVPSSYVFLWFFVAVLALICIVVARITGR